MDKKISLKGKKIPRFKSYQEEADFWDTHSPLDYGTWKEVKLEFEKPLIHILGVRLDAKTIDRLAQLGDNMGIGPSTLVRMWVLEKLKSFSRKSPRQTKISSHAFLNKITLKKSLKSKKP